MNRNNMNTFYKIVSFSVAFSGTVVWCQFFECYHDSGDHPEEGPVTDLRYSWLGLLQYIHIKHGSPHYYRMPRVVLIAKQFVLSTAVDAAVVPKEYALGNIIFGDYERDEEECKLAIDDIASGADCDPAVLIMPISDVLLHPEYKHFGVKNSIALLKLITPVSSNYVVPACLPFKDWIVNKKTNKVKLEKLFHIDYTADVPRDIMAEDKEIQKLSMLPRELCILYDYPKRASKTFKKYRMGCSTGCGLRSGAPSLVHEHTGHWSLVAMAVDAGESPCLDPLRPRRPPPPPHHILLFAYMPWITAAITGKALGAFAKDDPFGLMISRVTPYDYIGHQWVGHWWMGGVRCYDRGEFADDLFKFYQEIFQVTPSGGAKIFVNYYLELVSPGKTVIACVKVGMPYRYGKPRVIGIATKSVKVTIPVIKLSSTYRFHVEGFAYNDTIRSSATGADVSSTECSSDDSECIRRHPDYEYDLTTTTEKNALRF